MKKYIFYFAIYLFFSSSSFAGTDGNVELSKNNNQEVKDCFEGFNRGVFAFNQALDKLIVEPIANAIWYFFLDKWWTNKSKK